ARITRKLVHAGIELVLPRMAGGGVAQIVSQRNGFGQVFMQAQVACQRTRDLSNFDAVRQAGAEEVAFMVDEYLGLVFQQPEGIAMDDAVAIALEVISALGRGFGMLTAAAAFGVAGVGSKPHHALTFLLV